MWYIQKKNLNSIHKFNYINTTLKVIALNNLIKSETVRLGKTQSKYMLSIRDILSKNQKLTDWE